VLEKMTNIRIDPARLITPIPVIPVKSGISQKSQQVFFCIEICKNRL